MATMHESKFQEQIALLPEAIQKWMEGWAFDNIDIQREGKEVVGESETVYIPFDMATVTLSLQGNIAKKGIFKVGKGNWEFLEDVTPLAAKVENIDSTP